VKPNFRKAVGRITLAFITTFALTALAPQAHAQGGIPLWTNRYHGPSSFSGSTAVALAVDGDGDVIVTGSSSSAEVGFVDYVTIKYSNLGVPLWTNRFDGPAHRHDVPTAMAVDRSGNVFVTGFSFAESGEIVFPTVAYSKTGVSLWTNYVPTDGAIAADSSGNVFLAGSTQAGGVIIKYSGAGSPVWTNYFDNGGRLNWAVDSSDNVLVSTGSILTKYSSTGANLWTISGGGYMALDSSDNVIVAGGSIGEQTGWDWDWETIKYSSAGVPLWTNHYDGPAHTNDFAQAIAVDKMGNGVVTGYWSDSAGGYNYTTIKISNSGVTLWANQDGNGSYDFGRTVAVDTGGNAFVWGTSGIRAYSSAGLLLWTNNLATTDLDVDNSGNVFVTRSSNGDLVTMKYSSSIQAILTIARDGSSGLFIRITGAPDVTYRLQRAASVTGPWSGFATNIVPASGLIEYHETTPPPDQAFYRTVQP
jgi:hypothetical protein